MTPRHYRDILVRAINDPDRSRIDCIAAHLADVEHAKEMLIAKGFGSAEMKFSAIVRSVPEREPRTK